MAVDTLRVMGRATQGVRLIKIGGNDEISSVAKISKEEEEEVLDEEISNESTQETPESSDDQPTETNE
jgi:DNA gyrase subunit A